MKRFPLTDRCLKMLETKAGNAKAAYSYRLLDAKGKPIASGKKPQTTSNGAARYASITAASKAATAYEARTGETPTIDLAASELPVPLADLFAAADAKGMTDQQIADVCGTYQPNVSAWRNGRSEPKIGSIWPLADHLGIRLTKPRKR